MYNEDIKSISLDNIRDYFAISKEMLMMLLRM